MSVRQIFQKARQVAPCMLLFEDVDSMVTNLVRSYFLNELDGLENNDGILMVGSTNNCQCFATRELTKIHVTDQFQWTSLIQDFPSVPVVLIGNTDLGTLHSRIVFDTASIGGKPDDGLGIMQC